MKEVYSWVDPLTIARNSAPDISHRRKSFSYCGSSMTIFRYLSITTMVHVSASASGWVNGAALGIFTVIVPGPVGYICTWRTDNDSCEFSTPSISLLNVILFVSVVMLISIIIGRLLDLMAKAWLSNKETVLNDKIEWEKLHDVRKVVPDSDGLAAGTHYLGPIWGETDAVGLDVLLLGLQLQRGCTSSRILSVVNLSQ